MCPGLPQAPPTARKTLETVERREGRSEVCLRQVHAPACAKRVQGKSSAQPTEVIATTYYITYTCDALHAPAQTSIVQLRSVELLRALEVDVPEPLSPRAPF